MSLVPDLLLQAMAEKAKRARVAMARRVHPIVPDTAFTLEEFRAWGLAEPSDAEYGQLMFEESVPETLEELGQPPRAHPMDLF